MADYTNITNAALDGDSPGTQVLFEALRDNPIAITEGATGAPKIQTAAIEDLSITNDKIANGTISPDKLYPSVAGSLVDCVSFVVSSTLSLDTYTKAKEIELVRGGEYTISFDLARGDGTAGAVYAKIYKNGVAVGTERTATTYTTFTETISGWSPGDLLQVYAKTTATAPALVKELKVKASFIYNGRVTLE